MSAPLHPADRTLSITVGTNWAGIWVAGGRRFWRISLGWIAFTFYKGDFDDMLRAYLDAS